MSELALAGLSAPIRYSATLEAAIKDVLPATDDFDDPNFDATAHVNKLFPTEESLASIGEIPMVVVGAHAGVDDRAASDEKAEREETLRDRLRLHVL